MEPATEIILRHGLLLTLPILCALILRGARLPGWPVLGGLMAGILLGPTFLGGVSPNTYEQLFEGAVQQRIARDGLAIALSDPKLPPETRPQLQAALIDAEELWEDARWVDQRPLRCHTGTVVALTLLGAGWLAVRRNGRRPGLAVPASVGVWSAALPGALAFVAMTRWWGFTTAQGAVAAAAVAIGPWTLTRIDREAADAAELGGARMVQTAGRMASVIALPAALWGMWQQRGGEVLIWAAPLCAIILAWLIPPPRLPGPAPEKKTPDPFFPEKGSGVFFAREVLGVVAVPGLAACAAVKVDLFGDFAIWPVIVLLLLSGDARWLGAYAGAMLPGGRRWLRTMRLVMGSMACGPTQLAIAAIAVHTRTIPDVIPLALLLGAAYIEISVPLRRHMSRRLMETEEEIANISDDT
ncbi:MAG: hypothetical protein JSV91_15365 [Phycisphaerales bacterium]|nr:MAG: hypothetical protein JSV91_15365 [Phycisphaerales bacterium]